MNQLAMKPYGSALMDYFNGNLKAELIFRRDDGKEFVLPVSVFYRDRNNFTSIEEEAIKLCKGRVLDIGAGTGSQSLVLKQLNMSVTSIDIDSNATDIMKKRGLEDVHCCSVFEYKNKSFDTLLMLGHGIGMVETVAGLDMFLEHAQDLLNTGGQLLLDSLDVRKTTDEGNLAYHEKNRKEGIYIGQIRMKCEYQGNKGPYYGWLQADEETLKVHSEAKGWSCETIRREENGDYLARLVRQTITI